jgi:MFS family permease
MLVGLSMAELVSWGILYYTFSVFIRPMEAEMGWSRAQVTGAFSLALALSGMAAVPVGHWLDLHGPRALMTVGSALAAILLIAWSQAGSLLAFYCVWAGIGLTLAAVLYEPAFATVAQWFVRKRTRALTILTIFGGLASTVFVPLATSLLARYGWRRAVLMLAAILACTTIPLHGLLLRHRPSDVGAFPDGDPDAAARPRRGPSPGWRLAFRSQAFWAIASVFALSSFAFVAATVHLIPYLLQRRVSATTAAWVAGLIGAMQLPGRVLFGTLAARLGRRAVTASVFGLQALALAVLPFVNGLAGLVASASALGVGNGMATLLRASTVADTFGQEDYGKIGGGIASFSIAARAAGPIAGALAYSALHDYRRVYLGLAGMMAAAALLSLGAGRGPIPTTPGAIKENP